jgi:hypothetical protein
LDFDLSALMAFVVGVGIVHDFDVPVAGDAGWRARSTKS